MHVSLANGHFCSYFYYTSSALALHISFNLSSVPSQVTEITRDHTGTYTQFLSLLFAKLSLLECEGL